MAFVDKCDKVGMQERLALNKEMYCGNKLSMLAHLYAEQERYNFISVYNILNINYIPVHILYLQDPKIFQSSKIFSSDHSQIVTL